MASKHVVINPKQGAAVVTKEIPRDVSVGRQLFPTVLGSRQVLGAAARVRVQSLPQTASIARVESAKKENIVANVAAAPVRKTSVPLGGINRKPSLKPVPKHVVVPTVPVSTNLRSTSAGATRSLEAVNKRPVVKKITQSADAVKQERAVAKIAALAVEPTSGQLAVSRKPSLRPVSHPAPIMRPRLPSEPVALTQAQIQSRRGSSVSGTRPAFR